MAHSINNIHDERCPGDSEFIREWTYLTLENADCRSCQSPEKIQKMPPEKNEINQPSKISKFNSICDMSHGVIEYARNVRSRMK
jgi:hypothetical protein